MAEEGKGKIEKFNDYLYQKDLYLLLVGEKPETMNASEWAILDRKALTTVRLSLTPQVAFNISKEKTIAAVMKALDKLYEKPSASNKNNKQNNSGRSPTRGRSRSRGNSKSKGNTVVCWNCNKEGHKKNDCTKPKKKNGAGGRQGDDEGANMDVRHIPELQKNLISVSGLDREGYFVAFGENSERKSENHVIMASQKWKALVENETGNKIKCLKFDNGGEYRDRGFQEYCSNNGIRLIKTVKRTPQENDLAKRMNITIMERERCMRIHADLPLQFWAADVDTVVYLINRSPASALNGDIPEEEWSAYAHIDKEERKKLDSKSQKCVFIGYGGDEYGTGYKNIELKKKTRNTWNLMSQKMDRYPGQKIQKSLMRQLILKLELVISNRCLKLLTSEGNSRSAIHLAKNSAFHSRTKHIQLRYHFRQSLLEDGQLNLEKIEGNKNPVDMLTKVQVQVQVQGLYTSDGVFSLFFPARTVPHVFEIKSKGDSVSFDVPLNLKIHCSHDQYVI
ncbi:hypothetical protein RJ639_021124 [Escallonia herrerae]|uniref:Uncharacterized protein n=1 Tax=Escallonia herrerae TaxID=1293975 RepID=A0AA88V4I0_9ASTE|nr:hypothetical protein RJ639_021124 [Escallonia herrerae]